ncbi:HigA family addiction module antitoxin [Desulfurivibrio alkaliphilus]|uniref:Plasmid maintenance system antidote protein, XRE family n=1 Tax=Desulfurivibrio alkaliphilus (strain DSM 19089 / UNIQEM U267 / AHT2) TaxID=589865 RepID=D6Z6A1_DESAT|nr:HigA family addiction module antitoxin [Desulfurivibrio alkaliphilus]ADH86866.1 plasmid maintenance system antidote protein, XRE family [Desulfurivibrio alkaliphilus AHT 2]
MERLPNIHPGEVLREEFLKPLGISQYRLAKAIGVSPMRISEICAGKRSVTADSAIRLARALGTTPGFWLGLQADYDTEEAINAAGNTLDAISRLAA